MRDLLIGRAAIVDLDVSLVGANSQTFDRIAAYTGGTVSKRSQFTTAKLRLGDLDIDLAMARAEEYPTAGSLPVVRPGALEEDLARRDFSVNAMAVSLAPTTWGDLVDLHGGLADLDSRRLRILHEASFRDDPTRILRAARYSARLDLTLTTGTLDALVSSVRFLDEVSPARVRNELERVFLESDPDGAMALLSEWGALRAIHVSLSHWSKPWSRFGTETSDLPDRDRVDVAYAVLAYGLTDADANGLTARLNPDVSARQAIRDSASLGRVSSTDLTSLKNSLLAEILDPLQESAVLGATLASGGDLRRRLSAYLANHRHLRPQLTGNDLIAMGLRQGPRVVQVLKRLRDAWLDGEVSSPEEERAMAASLIERMSAI